MKRKLLVAGISAAVLVAIVVVVISSCCNRPFHLSSEFYQTAGITKINEDELKTRIAEKKSFLVFVSQPSCRAAEDFQKVLQQFLESHQLQIFEIDFSVLRDSQAAPEVRFYPSLLVYKNGKLHTFLEADNDDHAAAYTSLAGFTSWLSQSIILDN